MSHFRMIYWRCVSPVFKSQENVKGKASQIYHPIQLAIILVNITGLSSFRLKKQKASNPAGQILVKGSLKRKKRQTRPWQLVERLHISETMKSAKENFPLLLLSEILRHTYREKKTKKTVARTFLWLWGKHIMVHLRWSKKWKNTYHTATYQT